MMLLLPAQWISLKCRLLTLRGLQGLIYQMSNLGIKQPLPRQLIILRNNLGQILPGLLLSLPQHLLQ
jgi:hypothetical protein